MRNQVYVIGLVTSLATIYTACQDDSGSMRRKKFFGANGSGEMTTVDVEAGSTEEDAELSLAGEAVKSMKVKVSCDNVAEQVVEDSQFDLPVGATNCKAKLVSIKIGDKNYIEPVGGSGFDHYLAKDTGKFVNEADPKDMLFAKVKQQLPSPLKPNSGVQYVYSNVTQFDAVEVGSTAIPAQTQAQEAVPAPKIKVVKAFFGPYGGLNVVIQCTAPEGYVGTGTDVDTLKCGGVDVSKMKYAVAKQAEKNLSDAEIVALIKDSEFKDTKSLSGLYSLTDKTVTLNFGKKDKTTQVFVTRLTEPGKSAGYAYGFLKMSAAAATLAQAACPAQGAQANFVHEGVQFSNKMGTWKDTSNCWLWMRPETKKVKSADRFKQCPKVKLGETLEHRTLPYFTEFKAARDRKLVELAKGPAPKLGEDLDKTFWLAGGRVFNVADGSVREVKDIRPNETHSVLCVLKRD